MVVLGIGGFILVQFMFAYLRTLVKGWFEASIVLCNGTKVDAHRSKAYFVGA
jgi:hypothetical protein